MPKIEEYPDSGIHFRIFTIYGMELVWGVRAGVRAAPCMIPAFKADPVQDRAILLISCIKMRVM